jgi:hypothetical protein
MSILKGINILISERDMNKLRVYLGTHAQFLDLGTEEITEENNPLNHAIKFNPDAIQLLWDSLSSKLQELVLLNDEVDLIESAITHNPQAIPAFLKAIGETHTKTLFADYERYLGLTDNNEIKDLLKQAVEGRPTRHKSRSLSPQ